MSWWVYLEDALGQSVSVASHSEGGTYAVGGVPRAELNVTYNYGKRYREVLPEFEGSGILGLMLDGKSAAETLEMLDRAIKALGTERSDDYWAPTAGNAGAALATLRGWAREYPDATWSVS